MTTSTGEVASYSDWMSQLAPELHDTPLYKLAIPGSHDSMSYDLDINSAIIEPDRLKQFSPLLYIRELVRTAATTQDVTITQQLDAGVRYFDLRIAHKTNDPEPNKFYFYHGLCTRTDVETVLRDINDWAEKHPKEILILALSHFKDFNNNIEELHQTLIESIKTVFGAKLHNKVSTQDPFPTLKSCWDKGTNVIVSYDYSASQEPELWPGITYYYGNSMDPATVESKLESELRMRGPDAQGFFVCGLNLTLPEDFWVLRYIFFDNPTNVLQRSLPRMLQWLKQQYSQTPYMNIVASDLVTRDDFVSTVVQLNKPTPKCVEA
ncbi:PI-PLC X domain-containing protein 1-like [Perca flavescens]|uniref:PI-PLC X domain-containing protein 1-like n=1 Tax=Perca flavescens TaxID=8167 RepID=UPI00106E3D16|nr:PI-PLC X domain-containing protein 1-like [Perca flavescens]XP_028423451.1 PI-PLC X domain-containing protein 1-like [Perca flavescens]